MTGWITDQHIFGCLIYLKYSYVIWVFWFQKGLQIYFFWLFFRYLVKNCILFYHITAINTPLLHNKKTSEPNMTFNLKHFCFNCQPPQERKSFGPRNFHAHDYSCKLTCVYSIYSNIFRQHIWYTDENFSLIPH